MAQSVDPKLNFRECSQLINLDAPESHSEELFIQIDNVLDFVLFYYVQQVVLHVLENDHVVSFGPGPR